MQLFKPQIDPRTPVIIALVLLLTLTAYIYFHGIVSGWFLDDIGNLVINKNWQLQQFDWESLKTVASSFNNGKRPIAMLSFGLDYYWSGEADAKILKRTNLIIHLINVAGVYWLALKLLPYLIKEQGRKYYWWALLAAAIWALHPIQQSSVLYAVQRMALLSASFVIYGCAIYIVLRERIQQQAKGYISLPLAMLVMMLLAVLSKENGALFPIYLLLIELCCWQFLLPASAPRWFRLSLKPALWLSLAGTLSLLVILYFHYSGTDLVIRKYTLDQRLLTEARVLWEYLSWIAYDFNALVFFHDEYPLSTGLFSPATTIVSLLAWFLTIIVAGWMLWKGRLLPLAFAVLFFVTGHLVESTVIPLEIVFEHRNYLPSAGLAIGISGLLAMACVRLQSSWRQPLFVIISLLLITFLAQSLYPRVKAWRTPIERAESLVKINPTSPRAWASYGHVLITKGYVDLAIGTLQEGAKLTRYEPGYLFAEGMLQCSVGRRPADELLAEIIVRLKTPPNTAYSENQFRQFVNYCVYRAKDFNVRYLPVLKSVTETPNSKMAAVAFFVMGTIYQQQGDWLQAVSAYQEMIQRDKRAIEPHLQLIEGYLQRGEVALAKEEVVQMQEKSVKRSQRQRLEKIITRYPEIQQYGYE